MKSSRTDHLPAEQRPAEWCVAGSAVEEVGAALHGQPVQHAEQGVQAGYRVFSSDYHHLTVYYVSTMS